MLKKKRIYKKIYVAIPLLDELENLPALLHSIREQNGCDYKVFFCVNQPDKWWDDPDKRGLCERNIASIEYLLQYADFPFRIIDKASKGNGWQGKDLGVGWARKVVMDALLEEAGEDGLIITLDGDTDFNKNYFSSVLENFNEHPEAVGLSVPYYHKLTGREEEDRAILRYEIYMRNYAVNLWRISNPYSFTALGSAMALPVHAYKAIGGMSPKKSGEDFYFLQKLRKYGLLLTWNEEKVYPAARFSDRVFFGTGPAMIKGAAGDWESYPVYHHTLFDKVHETYKAFPALFLEDVPVPMDRFFTDALKQDNIWDPLRKNAKTPEQFLRACSEKVDGLRILQYLKHAQKETGCTNEECLMGLFQEHHTDVLRDLDFLRPGFHFESASVLELDLVRNAMLSIEDKYQKENHLKT
ncbi:MAG: hypothetical protein HQ565_03550 [Bacteroidetes bacterium]|nr:hypothetical protein [Bacteroidota bacterium]